MKQIKVEGLVDDLFSLFKEEPTIPKGSGMKAMDNLLDPHTVEDLYEGVILRLKSGAEKSKKVKALMAGFFPNNPKDSTIPRTVDPKLIDMYRDKMENAIVEFCTTDAQDIIQRTQEAYEDRGEDSSSISGDQYFGTILQQVHSGEYDLRDKLMKLHTEFEKEASKKKWQVSPEEGGVRPKDSKRSSYKRSEADDVVENIIELTLKQNPDLTGDDVVEALKNDVFANAIAGMIAKK